MTNQRGSALFYILIAIALLAALSYAVARSTRGNVDQLSAEQSRLLASDMLEYANVVASATGQIKMRGVKDSSLCFDAPQAIEDYDYAGCADSYNKIFDLGGGGVTYATLADNAVAGSAPSDAQWHIYGDNEVNGIGTTCGSDACADLALVASGIEPAVCKKINELLNVTDRDADPPTDPGLGVTPFIGTYGYNNTIGNTAVASPLNSQAAACFYNSTNSSYVFYKVLVAR